MIKSKIDARERALEFVASLGLHDRELIMDMGKEFTDFLIGDAELPEVTDDNGHLKELFEVAQREMEKINKRDTPDYAELMKAIQTGNAGIVGEIPCKSEAE